MHNVSFQIVTVCDLTSQMANTVFCILCHCPIVTMWNTGIILSAPLRFVYGYNWCLQPTQEESNVATSNSYSNSNRKSLIAHWATASGAVVTVLYMIMRLWFWTPVVVN